MILWLLKELFLEVTTDFWDSSLSTFFWVLSDGFDVSSDKLNMIPEELKSLVDLVNGLLDTVVPFGASPGDRHWFLEQPFYFWASSFGFCLKLLVSRKIYEV